VSCTATGATTLKGLGNLLSQRIPNYRNLMNGYSALTAQQK
jgi:hypothetical protein